MRDLLFLAINLVVNLAKLLRVGANTRFFRSCIPAVRHRLEWVESYDCPITADSTLINLAGTGDYARQAHAVG